MSGSSPGCQRLSKGPIFLLPIDSSSLQDLGESVPAIPSEKIKGCEKVKCCGTAQSNSFISMTRICFQAPIR